MLHTQLSSMLLSARNFVRIPGLRFMVFLLLLSGTGFAQPCEFSYVSTDGSQCKYQFTSNVNEVEGYLIKHFWDFGDGSTSDVANPKHSYPSSNPGGDKKSYTVTHTVTICDPFTLLPIGTFTCYEEIHLFEEGTPSCNLCPTLVEAGPIFDYHVTGCSVNFQAHIPLGFTAIWTFGDGTAPMVLPQNYTYTYSQSGIYTVTVSTINTQNPAETYRCQRIITVDCDRPCCDFTWNLDASCCFGLKMNVDNCNLSNASYVWYVNGVYAASGPTPVNLFPNGINICDIQQNGGIVKVSLVTQENSESCIVTKDVNLNSINNPGIYIGPGKLSDFENVLPGSSYCGPCPVHICGLVEVDKDFEFCGTEVIVAPGCGFDVDQGKTFTLSNGTHMHGCECLYRGILAHPGSTVNINGSTIEDAAYAVWTEEKPTLNLNHATFLNNYVGVRVDGDIDLQEFTSNLFSSDRILYPDCANILAGLGYITDISYAGMLINHNHAILNIPDDGNQNTFSHLAIGIYSANGTINLQPCCTFQDLTNCSAYQNGAPAGAGGRGVWFFEDDNFTSTGNYFHNVNTGILGMRGGSSTIIDINNNNQDLISRGIDLRTSGNGLMSGNVNNNSITANLNYCAEPGFGIGFEDATSGTNSVDIISNPIVLNLGQINTYGIHLNQTNNIANQQISAFPEVDVNNNPITVNNGSAGIHILSYHRSAVHTNAITLTGGGSPIGIHCTGHQLFLNEGQNVICHNTITSTTSNPFGTGLWIGGSIDNIIQNNTMTHTARGAFFDQECGWNTSFGCNTFAGVQGIGLQYSSTAHTGPQDNTGNAWTGSFNIRAFITPSSLLPNSVYTVPENDPIHDPGNTQQWNGQRWFETDPFITAPNCPTTNCLGYNRPADRSNIISGKEVTDLAFQLAPNPNAGSFIVTFEKNRDEAADLQVVSISGTLIKNFRIQPGESSLEISGIAPGVYFVKVISNGRGSAPVKMIVFK